MFRTVDIKFHDDSPQVIGHPAWPRPVGLGFPLFWLSFEYVVPAFKYSSKLVELVNVSKTCEIMVLKL